MAHAHAEHRARTLDTSIQEKWQGVPVNCLLAPAQPAETPVSSW